MKSIADPIEQNPNQKKKQNREEWTGKTFENGT